MRIDNLRKKKQVRFYRMASDYPEDFLNRMKDLYLVIDKHNSKEEIKSKDQVTEDMRHDKDRWAIWNIYERFYSQGTL